MSKRKLTFGVWLANTREALGKTRQDVASAIGCTPQSVANWESDANKPHDDWLTPLAKALRVRRSELALAVGKE